MAKLVVFSVLVGALVLVASASSQTRCEKAYIFPQFMQGIFAGNMGGYKAVANFSKYIGIVNSSAMNFALTMNKRPEKVAAGLNVHMCVHIEGQFPMEGCSLIVQGNTSSYTEYSFQSKPNTCPISTKDPGVSSTVWTRKKGLGLGLENEEDDGELEKKRGLRCAACEAVVDYVQNHLAGEPTQDKIRALIAAACSKIPFVKKVCQNFIAPVIVKVVAAIAAKLSSDEVCLSVHMCSNATLLS